MKKGGTNIYCPGCKSFTVCRAIPPTRTGKPKAQRWHRTDHEDISWFRRGRECLSCGHLFLSAEVDEAFIEELARACTHKIANCPAIAADVRFAPESGH